MQFEVFRHKGGGVEFVVDVQSDIIDIPGYRIVAPLYPAEQFSSNVNEILFPTFFINGDAYRMKTNEMASIPDRALGDKAGSLSGHAEEIRNAINMLFWGI